MSGLVEQFYATLYGAEPSEPLPGPEPEPLKDPIAVAETVERPFPVAVDADEVPAAEPSIVPWTDAGPELVSRARYLEEHGHVPAGTTAGLHGSETLSWRTLADIPDDPPRPLLFGLAEPEGPTLLYAAPGTGKGTTGSYIVVEAQREGMRPAIFDAERRPREWARRVSGLGGDRNRVVYLEPTDLGPKLAGRPLWESAGRLSDVLRAAHADLLLVDSILPAVGQGEERLRSDAQVPYLFVQALDALGLPSLSFGHPPKGQPEGDPFGSMAWLGAMRLTWLGTAAEGDGHRVRWRPRKRNERGHIPGLLLTFTYGDDGRPCSVEREDDEESTREWLMLALVRGPRSVAEMAEELLDEMDDRRPNDDERTRERFSRTLRRMAREGSVERQGPATGRNVRWALRLTGGA